MTFGLILLGIILIKKLLPEKTIRGQVEIEKLLRFFWWDNHFELRGTSL